ncbi:unnamed protein product [Adineta steineri]|uniref:Transmembrane protein n=1 Tax=Adineta steineri TaxID=433720 RepID=A0A813QMZ8_9BILA|nr:unnamed protein product [Adineta steineri]
MNRKERPASIVASHPLFLSQLWQKLSSTVRNFNLFSSTTLSTDEHQLQNQRISTRLFIILLTLSLTILVLYTSLINVTKTIDISSPTIAQYSQLYSTYPQTLDCTCTDISIDYDKFLQVNYTLHQICTSTFITDGWIDYLYNARPTGTLNSDDFRNAGLFIFQALNAFCQLSTQTISNQLTQFYSSQYVSASVTPSEVFQTQTQAFVSQFTSSVTKDFILSLLTIRKTTQSNALLNGQLTNYYLSGDISNNVNAYPLTYGDCGCKFSATCSYELVIYNSTSKNVQFTVPGIYAGCYVIEALLQSNLQCFYNVSCINEIQSYFTYYLSMNLTALDTSLLVQFSKNSTIEEVVDELMVEKWNSSIVYDGYYHECQPSKCSYSYETRNNVVYIITTVIGLVGGLITVLKLIVPRLVKMMRRKKEATRFETVNYTLHQICTSTFITDEWIDYLYNARPTGTLNSDDFRNSGLFIFQALNAFCQLSTQTISNQLTQFYSSQYVSASVTPLEVFQTQTQAFVSQFTSSVTKDFILSLLTIRKTTQSNALLNGQLTNYYLSGDISNNVYAYPLTYGDCGCKFSAICSYELVIYNSTSKNVQFTVPGIYAGCYVIEALLQSNLECFYNVSCINEIQSYFTYYLSMNLTTLDTSLLVQFSMNSTIEELVDELMVEKWNSSIVYDGYYNACQPSKCSYSYETRNNVVYIITTVIGLVGGLITVLKLIVPRLVKMVRRKKEATRSETGKAKFKIKVDF